MYNIEREMAFEIFFRLFFEINKNFILIYIFLYCDIIRIFITEIKYFFFLIIIPNQIRKFNIFICLIFIFKPQYEKNMYKNIYMTYKRIKICVECIYEVWSKYFHFVNWKKFGNQRHLAFGFAKLRLVTSIAECARRYS